jgi:hypothetical protein
MSVDYTRRDIIIKGYYLVMSDKQRSESHLTCSGRNEHYSFNLFYLPFPLLTSNAIVAPAAFHARTQSAYQKKCSLNSNVYGYTAPCLWQVSHDSKWQAAWGLYVYPDITGLNNNSFLIIISLTDVSFKPPQQSKWSGIFLD